MATSAKQWKKKSNKGTLEVALPSGNTCLARRPGMELFLTMGLLPNSLAEIVTQAIDPNKPEITEEEADDLVQGAIKTMFADDSGLAQMLVMVDQATIAVVVEPVVHPTPADPAERSDDLLYVDEVDVNDKMFLFNWAVGGADELARFRGQEAGNVESSRPRKAVQRQAKRAPRTPKR